MKLVTGNMHGLRGRRTSRVLPTLCSLEVRRLLSASLWRIDGTQEDDTIDVAVSSDSTQLIATINGEEIRKSIDSVSSIQIFAGDGDDDVSVNLEGHEIPVSIYGEAGDDILTGGSEDDDIHGGPGDDVLSGGLGNDTLSGNGGDDLLQGDEGDDDCQGDLGDDTIAGGLGDDSLEGNRGTDKLSGGFDEDTIKGGKGSDQVRGGDGEDALIPGDGRDIVYRTDQDRCRFVKGDTWRNDFRGDPLTPQGDVEALKQQLIEQAVQQYEYLFGQSAGGWWYPWYFRSDGAMYDLAVTNGMPAASAAGAPEHSNTNTQVQGVDEADIVKTDGNFIYLVHDQQLMILNAWPAEQAHVVATLNLSGWGADLYLDGSRLTVVSTNWVTDEDATWSPGWGGPIVLRAADTADVAQPLLSEKLVVSRIGGFWWRPSKPQVEVTVYDITDPAAPATLSTTKIDGSLTSSRDINGKLYLLLNQSINLPAPLALENAAAPQEEANDGQANSWTYETEEAYRARLAAMDIADLLPGYTTDDADDATPQIKGSLLADHLYLAQQSSDLSNLFSVVTIDAGAEVPQPIDSTSIAGYSGDMYMSTSSIYLTSTSWDWWRGWGGWGGDAYTNIYKFAVTDSGVAYDGAGQAPGWAINSFAMDETDGQFRIATTTQGPTENGGGWTTSNNIFVFSDVGDTLEITGSLTGLGVGERIYSARFVGDQAYLVTFRQVDPLFVIDLSDAEHPTVAGELKMPGYSSYLQPIGNHLLLGVGRDADEQGRVHGLKVSLFEVSDPANPRLVDTYKFPHDPSNGEPAWWANWNSSIAEWDHHAVSYFDDQQVLALPVLDWGWWNGHASLAVLKVDGTDGFTPLASIQHEGEALRSLRIGEFLYSIGTDAVRIVSFADPATVLAVVPLPPAAPILENEEAQP